MIKKSVILIIALFIAIVLVSCSAGNTSRYLGDIKPIVSETSFSIDNLSMPATNSLPTRQTEQSTARKELKKLTRTRRALSILAGRVKKIAVPTEHKLANLELMRLINDALFLSADFEDDVAYLSGMGDLLGQWEAAATTLSDETQNREEDILIFSEYKKKLSAIRVRMQRLIPPADFSETHNSELALISRKIQLGEFYFDVFISNNDILGYSLDTLDRKLEDEIDKKEAEIDKIAGFKSRRLKTRLRQVRRDQLRLLKAFTARDEAGQ